MPTAERTHHEIADRTVNRLMRIGLDLHRALSLVGTHERAAGQRIRIAMSRIDETIDELRHTVIRREPH